jgi:hypothetical protein
MVVLKTEIHLKTCLVKAIGLETVHTHCRRVHHQSPKKPENFEMMIMLRKRGSANRWLASFQLARYFVRLSQGDQKRLCGLRLCTSQPGWPDEIVWPEIMYVSTRVTRWDRVARDYVRLNQGDRMRSCGQRLCTSQPGWQVRSWGQRLCTSQPGWPEEIVWPQIMYVSTRVTGWDHEKIAQNEAQPIFVKIYANVYHGQNVSQKGGIILKLFRNISWLKSYPKYEKSCPID